MSTTSERQPRVSLPQYSPTQREIDDVELLRMGVLAPLSGFQPEGGTVTLTLPSHVVGWAEDRGGLEIVDAEGVPLAVVTIDRTYSVDDETTGVVGDVIPCGERVSRAFADRYGAPGGRTLSPDTVTVVVDAALTAADLDDVAQYAGGRQVLFLVLNGAGTARGVSAHGLIKATLAAAERFPGSQVVAAPLARRLRPEHEQNFRQTVAVAYAPGSDIFWPEGRGELTPGIAAVVRSDRPVGLDRGAVVFFTGLSGSGKSTIAQALRGLLLETGTRTVSLLDGDRVRRNLSRGLTFSRQDREINLERIAWVAAEAARHGGMAICSPIAPYGVTRQIARSLAGEVGADFVLIHVATPLAVCEARDRKGLYARARRGEIEMFTGISAPYEPPGDADLVIDTTDMSIAEALHDVVAHLVGRGLLPESLLRR